jgi:cyclic pyranopterin phosphate synthase
MTDSFGRDISYLRVSVTDRCNFRCAYCMSDDVEFLPRRDLLTMQELDRLCSAFVDRGVRKIRITGGEPLVRRGIINLFSSLSRHLAFGALDELTLTTNGAQLGRFARDLAACGVRRVNVSLDTLDPDRFRALTRGGDLQKVLDGIATAQSAGLAVKLNTVALGGVNDGEIERLLAFAHGRGMDLTLIELMPLGIGAQSDGRFLPLSQVRTRLKERFTLKDLPDRTGGPARYVRIAETGGRLGFITPLSQHFCASCNRVRVTCTGQLFTCLGQEGSAELRHPLRASESDYPLLAAIDSALAHKPAGHNFIDRQGFTAPSLARHMSTTGG